MLDDPILFHRFNFVEKKFQKHSIPFNSADNHYRRKHIWILYDSISMCWMIVDLNIKYRVFIEVHSLTFSGMQLIIICLHQE